MKSKHILAGLLGVSVIVVGYFAITCRLSSHASTASIYGIQSTSQLSRTLVFPVPVSNACQNSGNGHVTAPILGATYTTGSNLPVAWNITSPSAPTQVIISLVPVSGGSQILFARYSSATNVTTNGTITATTTRGGDSGGIIPPSISAGQYYVQIALTVNGSTGIACSKTFTISTQHHSNV